MQTVTLCEGLAGLPCGPTNVHRPGSSIQLGRRPREGACFLRGVQTHLRMVSRSACEPEGIVCHATRSGLPQPAWIGEGCFSGFIKSQDLSGTFFCFGITQKIKKFLIAKGRLECRGVVLPQLRSLRRKARKELFPKEDNHFSPL